MENEQALKRSRMQAFWVKVVGVSRPLSRALHCVLKERAQRIEAFRQERAAKLIQRHVRRWYKARQEQKQQEAGMVILRQMKKYRERQRHLERVKAASIIHRVLLAGASRNRVSSPFHFFLFQVRKVQRTWRSFNTRKKAQMELINKQWNKFEALLVCTLSPLPSSPLFFISTLHPSHPPPSTSPTPSTPTTPTTHTLYISLFSFTWLVSYPFLSYFFPLLPLFFLTQIEAYKCFEAKSILEKGQKQSMFISKGHVSNNSGPMSSYFETIKNSLVVPVIPDSLKLEMIAAEQKRRAVCSLSPSHTRGGIQCQGAKMWVPVLFSREMIGQFTLEAFKKMKPEHIANYNLSGLQWAVIKTRMRTIIPSIVSSHDVSFARPVTDTLKQEKDAPIAVVESEEEVDEEEIESGEEDEEKDVTVSHTIVTPLCHESSVEDFYEGF